MVGGRREGWRKERDTKLQQGVNDVALHSKPHLRTNSDEVVKNISWSRIVSTVKKFATCHLSTAFLSTRIIMVRKVQVKNIMRRETCMIPIYMYF